MARTLGVICARGGSKGFPRKNLATICDRPMLYHSIKAAEDSELLTRWVVSTDDEEIAEVARGMSPDSVPFMRPASLATDEARIEGALSYTLERVEAEENAIYDYVVMLLNTHPLRTSRDIDGCIRVAMQDRSVDSVLSGYFIQHPYELRTVDGVLPQYKGKYRRQDCKRGLFLGNGAVVVTKRDCLRQTQSIWGDTSLWYGVPIWRSIDVDSKEQIPVVEYLLRGMKDEVLPV